jgi:hypothetical protein
MTRRFIVIALILCVTTNTLLTGCSLGSLAGLGGLLGGGGGIMNTVSMLMLGSAVAAAIVNLFTEVIFPQGQSGTSGNPA